MSPWDSPTGISSWVHVGHFSAVSAPQGSEESFSPVNLLSWTQDRFTKMDIKIALEHHFIPFNYTCVFYSRLMFFIRSDFLGGGIQRLTSSPSASHILMSPERF